MINLYDLLYTTNDSAYVQILDNESGELLLEGEASDLLDSHAAEEYEDCTVMDLYAWSGNLMVCIER